MIYQTYGAVVINSVVLRSMEPSIVSLAGIGDIRCLPMSNLDVWSGAVVLCSWDKEPVKDNPRAMYLVDTEGDVHQFYGSIDVLMYEGVTYDLTAPYSHVLNVAEQVLMMVAHKPDAEKWWNEYVSGSIVMNLQGTDLIKYASTVSEKYNWENSIVSQIKNINVKSSLPPLHNVKRLHYLGAVREHQSVRHID